MTRRSTIADGERWKALYEADRTATFESIALDEGVSPATVRSWAVRAGVEPRPPGRHAGVPIAHPQEAASHGPSSGTGVRHARPRGGRALGKRRRGGIR